jgi:transglutaminase-like putative cysteine protease
MKFSKLFSLFIILVFCTKSIAQNFELGKVTIAELQEKKHPKDSTANAAVLFKKGEVYFEDLTTITRVRIKIKIYKKEGFEWANEEISHYINGESVSFSNATTYNLVDGKIEKIKLKKEGEFEQKINKYFSLKKITMPNVREGSIIEYEYTIRSGNFGSLRDWYFQSSIPVNYSEFKVKIPYFLTFNKRTKGFLYPKMLSEPTYNRETSEVYKLENIPSMKEESLVNNINNYRVGISYELALVNLPGYVYKSFSTDWDAVTKTIYDDPDFGTELNKTSYFEEDLKPLLKGLVTNEDKIAAIFNYVKSTVKWNKYTGYSCNDGVKKAYKDKTGNVAEINLMLTAMLRFVGLNANPVLISTRDNGIALFPSRTAFNYVIVAVETPEGNMLLDATEKQAGFGVLPYNDLNWIGRLIRKDGTSEEVDLMPKNKSNDVVTMNYSIDPKGLISGKLRRQLTDYKALEYRKKVEDVKEDTYLENLENENEKIEIKEYSRTNEKELKLPVTETFSFTGSNLTELIGGKIYINPILFYTHRENPFKQEVREYPIDYGYSFLDKYVVSIQVPDGYHIETLPASGIFSMQDNLGTFKYMTSSSGNTINVIVMHQINIPIISSEYYDMLKEFYQKMIDKQNEKIVLVKI